MKKHQHLMRPTDDQIKRACQDVAWEYDTMLAAALEMATAHGSPINHLVQEAFLVHVRSLAEFFRKGTAEFKKVPVPPERPKDNIYAVDFCLSVSWKPEKFGEERKLIRAINKTLSHMTYSRDRAAKDHEHFEGHSHLHGTVKLMRQTWGDFMKSIDPRFSHPWNPKDIHYWLNHHTRNWEVSNISRKGERLEFETLESQFETRVKELVRLGEEQERQATPVNFKWTLNQTPDELV